MVRYEIDAEALSAAFVVLWERMSAEAASLSPSEIVQRSAEEWSEEEACMRAGSVSEALRCVVRAELWESLSFGYDVLEAARSVALAVRDWRMFHQLPAGEVWVVSVGD